MSKLKHGQNRVGFKTGEYISWNSMKDRCYNENFGGWHCYGGRGITVCKEWRDSFEEFFRYMGKRPTKFHALDRINNDGNYEPGNVRWATPQQQAYNRRTNIQVEVSGVTKCAAEWAKEIGVDRHTISRRYSAGVRGAELLRKPRRGKPFKTGVPRRWL